MSEQHEPEAGVERPWWLGALVVAIGLFWVYGASLLPQSSTYARVGPGMFVTLAGSGLVVFGLLLLVQIARGERFEAQEGEDVDGGQPADWKALGTAMIGASLPLYLMERFGFVLTGTLVFAAIARAFGSRRPLLDLAIGFVLCALSWWAFSQLGVDLGRAWVLPKPGDLIPRFSLT